jgi:hypothetical protein
MTKENDAAYSIAGQTPSVQMVEKCPNSPIQPEHAFAASTLLSGMSAQGANPECFSQRDVLRDA